MKNFLYITCLIGFMSSDISYAGIVGMKPGRYQIDYSHNNWINPLEGELKTSTDYDYLSKKYLSNWGKQHLGDDLIANENSKVRAISQGVIYNIERKDSYWKDGVEYNLSVLYIRHKISTGDEFTAVYGHCSAVNDLKVGDSVRAGDHICDIKKFSTPTHLHFEISLNINMKSSKWGVLDDGVDAHAIGWRNPYYFLLSYYPDNKRISIPFRNVWGIISWYPTNNSCVDAWTVIFQKKILMGSSEKEYACKTAYNWLKSNGYNPDKSLFFGTDGQIGSCRVN